MGLPINCQSSSEREFDDKKPNTENTTHPDEPGKTQDESSPYPLSPDQHTHEAPNPDLHNTPHQPSATSPEETNDNIPTTPDGPHKPNPEPRRVNWTAEEESLLVELRESGMKWLDLAERLPGRSAISCRLHYVYRLGRQDEI